MTIIHDKTVFQRKDGSLLLQPVYWLGNQPFSIPLEEEPAVGQGE